MLECDASIVEHLSEYALTVTKKNDLERLLKTSSARRCCRQ